MGKDDGTTTPVRMLRDAVPTSRHAEMLFRMVVDLLGAAGHVESADGGKRLILFRRARVARDAYVPWPLVSLRIGGRLSHIIPIRGPAEAPPRTGPRVRLRHAGPGEVTVHDGPHSITVTYGDDGGWFETARSASVHALAGVVPVLKRKSAPPVELLAEFVAGLDLERHGPGTVHMPVPLPGALCGVWDRGLRAIRHGLFHARVPDGAPWAVADGYDGIALAWGNTRTEALARWRQEVERLRPAPPTPTAPPPGDLPPGAVRLTAPAADGEWPKPAPDNTPAAVVRLDRPPDAAPPFGDWTRLLGRFGETFPAALRRDVAGFTLIGDKLAEKLGAAGLAQLDDTLAEAPPLPQHARPKPYNCRVDTYRLVDEETGARAAPRIVASWQSDEFDPRRLEGDEARWHVVRQRWLDLA